MTIKDDYEAELAARMDRRNRTGMMYVGIDSGMLTFADVSWYWVVAAPDGVADGALNHYDALCKQMDGARARVGRRSFTVSTGWGDGEYPIYWQNDENGDVRRLEADFCGDGMGGNELVYKTRLHIPKPLDDFSVNFLVGDPCGGDQRGLGALPVGDWECWINWRKEEKWSRVVQAGITRIYP